ncbi:hypothetical protein CONPUDRAFT_147748 [Coniophora puteana RWD-64-598 SS2]|uniref:Uncharacterized protein n=1 Tax=Coniophora puteana (strain RWD-64-598) TaxID=741705 RepID=R7SF77_CONPW|nr:uncharacterized protein CONPUDRAFT_147748 [Coniophora puteana RWD-64-598 SS2]EIW74402.1 hypothetical protein CONPUDRAFT_147748 [Coniophora puteana RWD-64-598 SS2]
MPFDTHPLHWCPSCGSLQAELATLRIALSETKAKLQRAEATAEEAQRRADIQQKMSWSFAASYASNPRGSEFHWYLPWGNEIRNLFSKFYNLHLVPQYPVQFAPRLSKPSPPSQTHPREPRRERSWTDTPHPETESDPCNDNSANARRGPRYSGASDRTEPIANALGPITDFALVQTKGSDTTDWRLGFTGYRVKTSRVSVLVELKNNPSRRLQKVDLAVRVNEHLKLAKVDLEYQAAALFTINEEQETVVGIAIAGTYWAFRTISRRDKGIIKQLTLIHDRRKKKTPREQSTQPPSTEAQSAFPSVGDAAPAHLRRSERRPVAAERAAQNGANESVKSTESGEPSEQEEADHPMEGLSRKYPSNDENEFSDWEESSSRGIRRQARKTSKSLIDVYPDDVVNSQFPAVIPNVAKAQDGFSPAYRIGTPQSDEAFKDLVEIVRDSMPTALNDMDDRASSPEPAYEPDAMQVDDESDEEGGGSAPGDESGMRGSNVRGRGEMSGFLGSVQGAGRNRRYHGDGGESWRVARRKEKARRDDESDSLSGDEGVGGVGGVEGIEGIEGVEGVEGDGDDEDNGGKENDEDDEYDDDEDELSYI